MDIYDNFIGRVFHFLRQDPTLISLVTVLADPMQDTFDVCEFILDHSSIDTAEGEQLELLGELIGVPRPPAQEEHRNLFALCRLGEFEEDDGRSGFFDDSDAAAGQSIDLGGYFQTQTGLESQTNPGAEMSDADYRYLIRQKAEIYRSKMTKQKLFEYLITFGSKCLIDDATKFVVEIQPFTYYEINQWAKNYIETKGFKPAGISIDFEDNIRHESSI